jgi:ribose 5-phosphate isomerase B
MIIAIGSDHAGQDTKDILLRELTNMGHEVHDYTPPPGVGGIDYPDPAEMVARQVSTDHAEVGVLVCGTGIGMSITANKVPGVRAALCLDTNMARLSREHNDANVLCLGGRILSTEDATEITREWLGTERSDDERHVRRRAKISEIERSGSGS